MKFERLGGKWRHAAVPYAISQCSLSVAFAIGVHSKNDGRHELAYAKFLPCLGIIQGNLALQMSHSERKLLSRNQNSDHFIRYVVTNILSYVVFPLIASMHKLFLLSQLIVISGLHSTPLPRGIVRVEDNYLISSDWIRAIWEKRPGASMACPSMLVLHSPHFFR